MLRNLMLATALVLGLSAGALAAEQQQPQAPANTAGKPASADSTGKKAPPTGTQAAPAGHEGHHGPGKPATPADGMGKGRMGKGMMGKDMGMCPMMVGGDTKMAVKNLPNGVTITLTSSNAESVARLQKAAENMRSMHE